MPASLSFSFSSVPLFSPQVTLNGDKAVSVVFDNKKLKQAVPDMRTTVRFDQGVRIALDYILTHPEECQKEDPGLYRYPVK